MTNEEYMDLAFTVAEATLGQTSPNPSVGAVVVKDGRILGIGSHLTAGSPHAEVYAIMQAGAEAEGAEIYVTLEPCAHFGRTPPCADLIIEHKLRKVHIACLDPNPAVAGKGAERIKQAGIEVEVGLGEARALELNRKFFHFLRKKRPYVTLKAATTLDGKIATSTGDSKWITSEESRLDVHNQRHIHDAILVGINTVMKDNPLLTTRLPQGGKNPIRIILDTHLKIQDEAQVLNDGLETWIICRSTADVANFQDSHPGVKVLSLQTTEIEDVLDLLGEHNIQSLYVEGGSKILASFLDKQLFNECHWYIAPKILGGSDALSVIGGYSPEWMSQATQLDFISVKQYGRDIKIVARPRKEVS
ncbi:bifunctional diaminohydroxyphosphoribosylaminopyrimidine deaminase/5-amino-6-(5-phosphoribosylamino)uracil reductase RibD [Aquibacillus kalidii]|uniref:bifunctional diaminohydroxyphosphoribosylaminopyrimidine deaminase/5-amino-6-(5-phosphoribosylamino)uracil reductase RibD n=1 Tax=Aquibacillus kalidii TaxID=2762597 RepID=UPI001646E899|nr:bifunctional diaminohydroxyphosphoribosylaminopyrimidine deaminase/5-amino-6-(5-phosphoribosylamino)uracil reductase RibD [Aquibacillus kalidii]